MSPSGQQWTPSAGRFPRVSGDEPAPTHERPKVGGFSPRERG